MIGYVRVEREVRTTRHEVRYGLYDRSSSSYSVVVSIQLYLQGNLKPFIIAADAVVISTLGGTILGLSMAKEEQSIDEAAAERDRFQVLFENLPNPIVGVEFVGEVPIVRTINPAFTKVFGFDRETILNQTSKSTSSPKTRN